MYYGYILICLIFFIICYIIYFISRTFRQQRNIIDNMMKQQCEQKYGHIIHVKPKQVVKTQNVSPRIKTVEPEEIEEPEEPETKPEPDAEQPQAEAEADADAETEAEVQAEADGTIEVAFAASNLAIFVQLRNRNCTK